jgi:hypothetical protein
LSSQNKFFELLDPEYGPDIAEDEIFRSSGDSFHMDLHDLGLDPIQTDLKSNYPYLKKFINVLIEHLVCI